MNQKTALIAGATGLVGGHLLKMLLDDPNYIRIISIGRRSSGLSNPKLVEINSDFENLEDIKDKLQADHIFCCLGTTMKKAGSKKAFQKVDYEYPLGLAKISKANGSEHFLLVTAQGANPKSMFFYNRVKGQLEEAVREVGFDHFTIIRPALIFGDRKEKRRIEELGKFLFHSLEFMFIGPFKGLKGVQAIDIARKLKVVASDNMEKLRVISSAEIHS